MWTYGNVVGLLDPLNITISSVTIPSKSKQRCGRQNAGSEPCKKQILQEACQVTKQYCDAEMDVEFSLGKPDFRMAEKQLSIVICECRPAAGFAPQHQQTGTDKEYR